MDSYSYSYTSSSSTLEPAALMAVLGIVFFIVLIVMIPVFVGMWKVFEKAGKPGWAALVPIYNTIVLLELADKPTWWVVLTFISPINIVILALAYIELAKKFGKDSSWAIIWLVILPVIGWPMLGFGDARFQGAAAAPAAQPPVAPPTPPVAPTA